MSEKPPIDNHSDDIKDNVAVNLDSDLSYSLDENSNYYITNYVDEHNPKGLRIPTEDESKNLRRILGRIKPSVYILFIAEFAERASYYGVNGVLQNFIQRPLPSGSKWGAPVSNSSNESAGALNRGLQTANALTLLLTFLAYVLPLYGGYVSDTKLGKFKTIWIGVGFGFVSHVLFIIAAIPSVISNSNGALAVLILAIITLALCVGFVKPTLLPLLLDQFPHKQDVVQVLPSGEKVIIDVQKSLQSLTLIFYWSINVGAFMHLATSYCARRVGFWLAFFVPSIVYLFIPVAFWVLRGKLVPEKPEGSILTNALKILKVSWEGKALVRIKAGEFWEYAKPSNMVARGREFYNVKKQTPISWNDQWVLDIKQTVEACKIFVFYPLYNLANGGISSLHTSLAGSMTTEGIPNDLFNNFNPLTIIVLIPILDYVVYPTLRKHKIEFKPVWRITFGFFLAALSNVVGSVYQHQVYQTSPCGSYATNCELGVSPLSAWRMVAIYILAAASECFVNVTAYELAYTRSPPHMKALVVSFFLFTTSISAAIAQGVTPALKDPNLVWPQVAMVGVGVIGGALFFLTFRNLHVKMAEEEITRNKHNSDKRAQELQDSNYADTASIKA